MVSFETTLALLLLLATVATAQQQQQHVIVVTGNSSTAGAWTVDGGAPADLELVVGALYTFDVRGAGVDSFFVGANASTPLAECGPSPCAFNVTLGADDDDGAPLLFGLDDADADNYREITLVACDALADAGECTAYSELCEWCQAVLGCGDIGADCTDCSAVPLATCGNASSSPGCAPCPTLGTCIQTTHTCPPCSAPPLFFKILKIFSHTFPNK